MLADGAIGELRLIQAYVAYDWDLWLQPSERRFSGCRMSLRCSRSDVDGAPDGNEEDLIETGSRKGSVRVLDERRRVIQSTLRDLARRPLEERHRVLREARIAVDPEETRAWDTTLLDLAD